MEHYISYYARDYQRDSGFAEKFPMGDSEQVKALADRLRSREGITSGEELRTYRLAVGATGEYSQFHGGNIIDVLSEIVTAINRVTGIYEREVAVRMQLVGNNDQLIFLNPALDPYSNDDGFAMLNQNVSVLNSIIGSANYDIGHVFSTGGGGVAWLGVVCSSAKAKGVTGLPNPLGDPFYVDYVAHEIGHQFGGNHTFNGSTGSCSGGTRNPSTAYEPGSGSTIMAYAGICGSQNLQSNSDDYFHGINFDEIVAFSTTGVGNSCPSITNTSNSAPHVDAGPSNFTLPANTPFILSGSASDPDNDPLTYSWEEFDLGLAGDLASPQGNAPIVRSFPPQSSPFRIIPRMSDIVNNTQTIGEFLPVYSRNLVFRLTARDNHASPGAGGVAYDAVSFNVTDQAGPFRVTAPNTNESWSTADPQNVSWNVANTNAPPVNCSKVNILLSTDGGYNYSSTLASNQVNDGSAIVTLPYVTSSKARIKIECADNIFFDISDSNFSIRIDSFGDDHYFPLILKG